MQPKGPRPRRWRARKHVPNANPFSEAHADAVCNSDVPNLAGVVVERIDAVLIRQLVQLERPLRFELSEDFGWLVIHSDGSPEKPKGY